MPRLLFPTTTHLQEVRSSRSIGSIRTRTSINPETNSRGRSTGNSLSNDRKTVGQCRGFGDWVGLDGSREATSKRLSSASTSNTSPSSPCNNAQAHSPAHAQSRKASQLFRRPMRAARLRTLARGRSSRETEHKNARERERPLGGRPGRGGGQRTWR